jgi:hypothetical protein
MSVMQYAPDNPDALYYAAAAFARSGDARTAMAFLEILYKTTYDRNLLNRARLLEALIEQESRVEADSSGTEPLPE